MKVGILTFTNGTNIGQRLQNYALQTILTSLGHEVCTIKQGFPFNKTKRNIRIALQWIKDPKYEHVKYKRKSKFDSFNNAHIKFYSKELPFNDDNSWIAKNFDAFIVGSDQVWNPDSPFVGDNFFLTFARSEQRMTYAPSFSVDQITSEKVELYKNRLNGFQNITVREDAGANIVEKLTGKQAQVVLDPTLLLAKRDWDKIKSQADCKPNRNYILAMFLGEEPQDEVSSIAEKLDMPVLHLKSDTVIGPDEFLDIVESADIVLTDSYHVSIFSVIYRRPFVNFTRSGSGASMSSRFETLYRLLGINSRNWVNLKSDLREVQELDFAAMDKRIEQERTRSIEILKENMRGVR